MLRKLTFTGFVGAAVLGWAAPALAHVTVAPPTAAKGAITFPTDPPIVGLSPENIPGWTAKVTTQKLDTPIQTDDGEISTVVSNITWTATSPATGIRPETFQNFAVLAGEIPDKGDQVVFKAVQTYANGNVVNWVDPVTEGGPAAEHPTPIMALEEGATGAHGGETTTTVATNGSASSDSGSAKDDADTAKTIGIVAIVFSVLALIGVAIGFAMRRRPAG